MPKTRRKSKASYGKIMIIIIKKGINFVKNDETKSVQRNFSGSNIELYVGRTQLIRLTIDVTEKDCYY